MSGEDTVSAGDGYAHLHADAVASLLAWRPDNAAQEHLRQRYLDHLERHPDGVARGGPPVHVTVGLLVLSADRRSVLLTLHRKAKAWFQFGGHLEPGDRSLVDAAAREGREESGLTHLRPLGGIVHLDAHTLPAAFGTCREHLDIRYVALAEDGAKPAVSEESLDVAWWPVDALPLGSADDVGPLVRAALHATSQTAHTAAGNATRAPRRA